MTSLFDSKVYLRRNETPWAVMSLSAFMKEMAVSNIEFPPCKLICQHRHSVASRYWWSIEWTDEQGQEHRADAQELDLCLWRAAQIELQVREQRKIAEGSAQEMKGAEQ